MPRGQPFTQLCQLVSRLGQRPVADLHVHTTASDGDYTPSQVAALARQAGLNAVAVTDHDTLAGIPAAEEAGQVRIIRGIELTADHAGQELHILAYGVRPCPRLEAHLQSVCERRRERFREFVQRLADRGIVFPSGLAEAELQRSTSVGRRHLASLLVRAGISRTRFAAFREHLEPVARNIAPVHRTPIAPLIRLIRDAGGLASLAHPGETVGEEILRELRAFGLQAVEVAYPAATAGQTARLRALAQQLGLAVTGGSDCHGPEPAGRRIGSRGVTQDELATLESLAEGAG